jgi:hypothetical protein
MSDGEIHRALQRRAMRQRRLLTSRGEVGERRDDQADASEGDWMDKWDAGYVKDAERLAPWEFYADKLVTAQVLLEWMALEPDVAPERLLYPVAVHRCSLGDPPHATPQPGGRGTLHAE